MFPKHVDKQLLFLTLRCLCGNTDTFACLAGKFSRGKLPYILERYHKISVKEDLREKIEITGRVNRVLLF